MAGQVFVTGTDTGVGKTVLSALLCAALDGVYWKPIQTGAGEGTDRRVVMALAELPSERTIPESYVFDPPVSPHWAAQASGVTIDLSRIAVNGYEARRWLIVEGAGGVMVPLNERELMLDLMRWLGMPVVVAARSTLGTINHTLLTLAALGRAGLRVKGVVLIGTENKDNRESIERYGSAPVIGRVPWLDPLNRQALVRAFDQYFEKACFL